MRAMPAWTVVQKFVGSFWQHDPRVCECVRIRMHAFEMECLQHFDVDLSVLILYIFEFPIVGDLSNSPLQQNMQYARLVGSGTNGAETVRENGWFWVDAGYNHLKPLVSYIRN